MIISSKEEIIIGSLNVTHFLDHNRYFEVVKVYTVYMIYLKGYGIVLRNGVTTNGSPEYAAKYIQYLYKNSLGSWKSSFDINSLTFVEDISNYIRKLLEKEKLEEQSKQISYHC